MTWSVKGLAQAILKWQPTPVFLPGKSHGQRSLAGCSLWGHRVGHGLATEQQQSYSENTSSQSENT